jgi:hypothetical protein
MKSVGLFSRRVLMGVLLVTLGVGLLSGCMMMPHSMLLPRFHPAIVIPG